LVTPGQVTAEVYNLDIALRRKREMMVAWADWLDKWALAALAADTKLSDIKDLKRKLARGRAAIKGRPAPSYDED
jgi:hypothetical protein